jgi:hypothetical protein
MQGLSAGAGEAGSGRDASVKVELELSLPSFQVAVSDEKGDRYNTRLPMSEVLVSICFKDLLIWSSTICVRLA